MLWLRLRKRFWLSCLSGLSLLGLTSASVQAQSEVVFHRNPPAYLPAQPCCPPGATTMPGGTAPSPAPGTTPTPTPTPETPSTQTPGAMPSDALAGLSGARGGEDSFALGLGAKGGAYLDSAIPMNTFRMRFDAAYHDNRPDRAEFFYPKCGCFRAAGIDPNAPGPVLSETSVNYQDISAYLELKFLERFSGFLEVPIRFINPEQNDNTAGLGDMYAGFKYNFYQECNQWLTFQFRASLPTGDPDRGLGIDIVRLEPAFLYLNKLSDKLIFQAELRDSIPISGTDFAGNVLRYGVGLSYDIYQADRMWIEPVAELVGWTVLDGKESTPTGAIQDASGDFIMNAKFGVRFGMSENSSLYLGYSRALTGEVWYRDMWRAEVRFNF